MLQTLDKYSGPGKRAPGSLLTDIRHMVEMARQCETTSDRFRLHVPTIGTPASYQAHVNSLSTALAHKGHAIVQIMDQAQRSSKLFWSRIWSHAPQHIHEDHVRLCLRPEALTSIASSPGHAVSDTVCIP